MAGPKPHDPIKDFWRQVNKSKSCWLWMGVRLPFGYGRFYIKYKCVSAHRHAWTITFGEIPKGLWVLHKCDNPPCVNPKHLFLGTIHDNTKDMLKKKRQAVGEKCRSAVLTANKVLEIRKLYKTKSGTEIAKKYGVTKTAISAIIHRRTWKHI